MHVSSSATFWDGMNEKFFTKYKGIDKIHAKWSDLVVAGQPIEGPLGRSWSINMGAGFKIPLTLLSNHPVQGTGADVMMIARISAYKRLKALQIPCKWVSTVHDSIVVDVPDEHIQVVAKTFHEVFRDLPQNIFKLFGYTWTVPMECECKQGKNMKEMFKIA